MRVLELWRYPVKSLGGERLESVEVSEVGLKGDRAWGLFEPSSNTVLTARRAPELLFASARMVGDEVVITLPDGTETNDDSALTSWLGREVTLVRPTDEGATYENPLDVEHDADWVSWQGPAGSFHDSKRSQISLVGRDSLEGRDIRRFRSNVVVEGGGEDRFVGSQMKLGTALLDITKQIDRCVMVTRPQPGLERDLDVFRDLVKRRNNLLSVGALVIEAGTVSLDDELIPAGA